MKLATLACAVVIAAIAGLVACKPSPVTRDRALETPVDPSPPSSETTIEVAITVDDLPVHGPAYAGIDRLAIADRMLAAFAERRVGPVYGFVNGKHVDDDPATLEILRRFLAAGHRLGNHTWSHPSLNTTAIQDYLADIERGEAVLTELDALHAWRAFRYPFLFEGDTPEKRDRVRAFLHERGYTIAKVSIDGNDWAFNTPYARCRDRGDDEALARITRDFVDTHVVELRRVRALTRALVGREIKHVLLLHIGAADADALGDLLDAYAREGVKWISLEEALADPFYALEPEGAYAFGSSAPYRLALERGIATEIPMFIPDLDAHMAAYCPE